MLGRSPLRRAHRFARAVDADPQAEQPALDDATRQLVAIVERLRAVRVDSDPTPEFKSRLRERLIAAAATTALPVETLPHGASTRYQQPRRHVRRTWAPLTTVTPLRVTLLAGALALVMLLAGAVIVSHRAIPGDRLYALKRTAEHVELALARGDEAKAHRHLDFARNRATELVNLVDRMMPVAARSTTVPVTAELTDDDLALITSALDDMDAETREGTRLLTTYAVTRSLDAPLADLAAWASDERRLVQALLARLGGTAAARARVSLGLIDAVLLRGAALRAELACPCLDSRHSDELGPLPCQPCQPVASPQRQPSTRPTIPQERTSSGSRPDHTEPTPRRSVAPAVPAPTAPRPATSSPTPTGPPPPPSTSPPGSRPPSPEPTAPDDGLLPTIPPPGPLPPLLPGLPGLSDLLSGLLGG